MSVSALDAERRWRAGVAIVLAGLGCVALVPWVFVTMIEVDAGWEDAIWRYAPWNVYAWAATGAGALAAVCALVAARRYARRRDRRVLRACGAFLAGELAAAAVWVGLAFSATS